MCLGAENNNVVGLLGMKGSAALAKANSHVTVIPGINAGAMKGDSHG
jgi:hypothetical protein